MEWKIILFVNFNILYMENLEELPGKSQLRELIKVSGYTINTQKSMTIMYINNKLVRSYSRRNSLLKLTTK